VPWVPELFSAPTLEEIRARRRARRVSLVRFFEGLITGDLDALVGSFAGEPELHHPVRGRIKGAHAFERYVTDTQAWMADRNITIEEVDLTLTRPRGVEEVVLHIDGDNGRIALPLAIATDHAENDRIVEMRIYHSTWPLTGGHANRPPVLQPDPELREPDVVGEYQRALAAGDVDGAVAAFEPDGSAREPAGDGHVHRGTDELRALYELFFSNGGGIPLEHCAITDDGRACALEYNVVKWGQTELPPEAGIAVYVRGQSGKLAMARIYDDTDPPLAANTIN
jgi:SnoaL-like protein